MNKYLSRFKEEYRKEGLAKAAKKTYKNLSIRLKRKRTLNKRSFENWSKLKDKYKGQRVFLVGNGPSLNKTPLYLLKNEFTMCFNRFNVMYERLSWKPHFYMCADALVAQDMAKEINEITKEVQTAFFPDIHTHGLDFRTFINDRENIQWMFPDFKDFYFDLPKVALGGTVAYPALQVLTFLGFSEIYIIGVDMNYQIHTTVKEIHGTDVASTGDDDPNHFDPRYFGTNRKYHQPVQSIMDNMLASLDFAAKKIRENTDTKAYNAGIGSMVKSFPIVNFESLFSFTEEEKYNLFSDFFRSVLPFTSFEELKLNVPEIESVTEIDSNANYFLCEAEIGFGLVKKLVFDYLAFGPYNDKMLFISRSLIEEKTL
jgi:hypothetical protein